VTLIVAVQSDPATARICLDAAAIAAVAVPAGEVEAFHARVKPESLIMVSEEVMTDERRAELVAWLDKKSQTLQGIVREWAAAYPTKKPSVWKEVEGDRVEAIVADRGKTADLIVIVRPAEQEGREALHAAIFDSGRLLLVIPPAPARPSFGRHIAIAWKPSDQAARAVTASIPWLKRAERVSLLLANAEAGSPDDALALLDPHGIKAGPVLLNRDGESVGAVLLREAHAIGADSLVMGAYRHSHLREMILGGVTLHMLRHADLPAFMLH